MASRPASASKPRAESKDRDESKAASKTKRAPRRSTTSSRSDGIDIGAPDVGAAAASATKLVQRAASILEEELANGIDAVLRLETRFVDVEAQRLREDDDLVLRFRRDAHEIVDILIDLVDLATGGVGGLARAIRITGAEEEASSTSPRVRNGTGRVPVLEVGEEIARGATGTVQMLIENDEDTDIAAFALVSSGLVNQRGDHIEPERVTFDPNPFDLSAQSSQRVTVSVSVPKSVTAGAYSGLVQTTKLDGVRAVVIVTVV